jgi:hypothetical protein
MGAVITRGKRKPRSGRSRRVKGKAAKPLTREQQWLRLWSVARYDLGLSKEEFYQLNPRQLDALIKRKEQEDADKQFLFAQLTSAVINFSMCHPTEPTKPADFMPSEWLKIKGRKKDSKQRKVRVTRKRALQVNDELRNLFSGFEAQGRVFRKNAER